MRNIPAAEEFVARAEEGGVRAAVEGRDGPFGDYSQAPDWRKPDPNNVIRV
jgi:enoyl-CoA hydratase